MPDKELRIVDWVDWCDVECNPGVRDVSTLTTDEFQKYREAVVKSMKESGYKFTGFYHQNGEYGVPIFEDGVMFLVSQRTWGGIMADVMGADPNDRLAYMNWAYMPPENETQITKGDTKHHSILFQ